MNRKKGKEKEKKISSQKSMHIHSMRGRNHQLQWFFHTILGTFVLFTAVMKSPIHINAHTVGCGLRFHVINQ